MKRNRIDFHQWYSMLKVHRQSRKSLRNVPNRVIYQDMRRNFTVKGDVMTTMACDAEETWHEVGQPYYKVWPGMCQALGDVNIDIDGSYLYLPFPTYEIRLPKTFPVREYEDAPILQSLLVHKYDGTKLKRRDDAEWTLLVHYQFDNDMPNDWMGWYCAIGIKSGQTIAERFKKALSTSANYESGYVPSPAFIDRIIRMAVSVAFFGIHEHQMVMPDIPNRYIERYHQAVARNDKEERDKLLERARKMGHFGWTVGSEIDLPQPFVKHINEDASISEPHRSLQFGHVRCGHLRLQPFGPRENPERKIIFIPPTVVRPDLPLQHVRGFRIGNTK